MNTTHTLYTKDKKVKITFRTDEAMGEWLAARSKTIGLTPSAFVRQLLYQQWYAEKTIGDFMTPKPQKAISAETAVDHADN